MTSRLKSDNIRILPPKADFVLKDYFKILLSKKVFERVAQNLKLSKIKLRFPKRFLAFIITIFTIFTFLGYYPTFSIPPIKRSEVYAAGQEQKGEVLPASFSKPLNLPHPGYISTRFSIWHPGIDIATTLGTPVHPVISGEISKKGFDILGLGNYVVVTHENGFKSKYAHMDKIYVKIGQKVTSEDVLGEVGLTGHTSGPHTHLEITHNGEHINPQDLLPEIPSL